MKSPSFKSAKTTFSPSLNIVFIFLSFVLFSKTSSVESTISSKSSHSNPAEKAPGIIFTVPKVISSSLSSTIIFEISFSNNSPDNFLQFSRFPP